MKHIVIATILLAGCDSPEEATIADTHNVIAMLPLTGPFAGKGPEHLKALQKGVVDLDLAGGVDKPIRLFILDAADATLELNQERLNTQIAELTLDGTRHVAAIVSSTTGAMKGAAPTALVEGIPFFEISSGSGLDEVTLTPEANRNFSFALRPLCMPEPIVTAELLAARASTPGWGNVFVLRGSQAHDKMHTREIRAGLTARGQAGLLLNATDIEMPNEGPFEAYIDQAIAANAEVIYWHLNGDSFNLAFLQAAERQGFTGKVVTCGMARNPKLLGAVDPGISPYLSGGSTSEGRLFFAMRGPVPSPSYDTFQADYATFAGVTGDAFTPSGYDAMTLIGLGIAAAGTSENVALQAAITAASVGGQKFGYGELAAALEAAKAGVDIDLEGTSGSLDLIYDDVLGNTAVGQYYFESVVQAGAEYKYSKLASPVDIR